jgi:hypothetical protein
VGRHGRAAATIRSTDSEQQPQSVPAPVDRTISLSDRPASAAMRSSRSDTTRQEQMIIAFSGRELRPLIQS